MIHGFSLAPIGERPPPMCAGGWNESDGECVCYPRFRGSTLPVQIQRNGTIIASNASDITSVSCPYYWPVLFGGDAPTSADAQVRPFLKNGNVFIHIIDGRVGHIFSVTLNITRKGGSNEQHTVLMEITA